MRARVEKVTVLGWNKSYEEQKGRHFERQGSDTKRKGRLSEFALGRNHHNQ